MFENMHGIGDAGGMWGMGLIGILLLLLLTLSIAALIKYLFGGAR
jgi:hypothetical protein